MVRVLQVCLGVSVLALACAVGCEKGGTATKGQTVKVYNALDQIRSDNPREREAAAKSMADMGPMDAEKAIPALREQIKKESDAAAKAAMQETLKKLKSLKR